MLKRKRQCLGCLVALVMGIPWCAESAMAVDKSYFNRKVIEIIVATKPGGGFDTDARLLAPYLQKELPGSSVIVRNVPGGGHIVATNRVWNSPPNGLTLGFSNIPGLIVSQVRGEEGIQFDLRKFTWLARLYSKHRFMLARKNAGFDTVEDLMKGEKEFKIGTAGVGDGPYNTGLLTANALGLKKVRFITSYGGSAEVFYGMVRKEVEGAVGTWESFGQLIEQGEANPIVLFDLKRWDRMGNVPILMELVKTDIGKSVASYLSCEGDLIRAVYTSPKVPSDIAQILSTAILKAVQNEEHKKAVAKMEQEAYDPVGAEETVKRVTAAINMPPELASFVKKLGPQK